jgi:hypothetical protein
VDPLTFDLRWKAACGYAIDATCFDSSALTYWRRRLASSDRPQRIFEVVHEMIQQLTWTQRPPTSHTDGGIIRPSACASVLHKASDDETDVSHSAARDRATSLTAGRS